MGEQKLEPAPSSFTEHVICAVCTGLHRGTSTTELIGTQIASPLHRRSGVRSKAAAAAGVQGAPFCLAPPMPVWHPSGRPGDGGASYRTTSNHSPPSLSAPLE